MLIRQSLRNLMKYGSQVILSSMVPNLFTLWCCGVKQREMLAINFYTFEKSSCHVLKSFPGHKYSSFNQDFSVISAISIQILLFSWVLYQNEQRTNSASWTENLGIAEEFNFEGNRTYFVIFLDVFNSVGI